MLLFYDGGRVGRLVGRRGGGRFRVGFFRWFVVSAFRMRFRERRILLGDGFWV